MNYVVAASLFIAYLHISRKWRKPFPTVESLREGMAKRKGEQMPASAAAIRTWLNEASDGGARWVVIKCDQFEYRGDPSDDCCYPVPLTRASEVHKVMGNGDRTMEVYDLALSIDSQMKETKAWHPPEVAS